MNLGLSVISAALRSAIELDFFTAIGEGANAVASLAGFHELPGAPGRVVIAQR